jgi:hypothetical protein
MGSQALKHFEKFAKRAVHRLNVGGSVASVIKQLA